MSEKRVLVQIKGKGEDGCAFYRGAGPWSHLAKNCKKHVTVKYFSGADIHWSELRMTDVIFLMRPHDNKELQLVERAKKLGTKVWIDFDDDLFALTSDNPARFLYLPYETKQNMEKMIKLADVVTVTTKELEQKMFSLWAKKVVIIPNAYDPFFDEVRKPSNASKKTKILYRGTHTHQRDLASVNNQILTLDKYYDIHWVFVGLEPWCADQLKSKTYIAPRGVLEYFETLGMLRCDIGIVPLVHSQFNLCKSNIAAMELSLAGAVTVAPNWPEWNKIPGVTVYNSDCEDSFYYRLVTLINESEENREFEAQKTFTHFRDSVSLEITNWERLSLLKTL